MPREVVPMEIAARPAFRHLLHHAVRRKQHVRAIADEEAALDRHARGFQRVDFASSAAGSMTRPLPMTACLPGRRMPLGISFRTNFLSPMNTVWPALCPP